VFPGVDEMDGEMTDIARPAQTGQYRSVPPSGSHLRNCQKCALFKIAHPCGNHLAASLRYDEAENALGAAGAAISSAPLKA
jgi:hypothetical protein